MPRIKKNSTESHESRSVPALHRGGRRNENKDERLTILSRESPRGDQRWFLQAVADGNQRRMLDVGCRAFAWVVLFRTICHSGKPTTPFPLISLPRARFPLSSPAHAASLFIAANRRNMPTRGLRHPSRRNSRTD